MDNLRQAYQYARENRGVSYGLHTGVPTTGFMVSLYGKGSVLSALTEERMAEFIRSRAIELDDPSNYFGAWNNPKNGFWYLDVSVRVDTLEEARKLAIQNKQLAIYDVAKKELIYLN